MKKIYHRLLSIVIIIQRSVYIKAVSYPPFWKIIGNNDKFILWKIICFYIIIPKIFGGCSYEINIFH